MYIWTETHEIINLDHYARVDILPIGSSYCLFAFAKPTRNIDPQDNGVVLAKFTHQLDAEYSRCMLFNNLIEKGGVWDATAIDKLSEVWKEVKTQIQHNVGIKQEFLDEIEINVTGLDEITITYDTSKHINDSALQQYEKAIKDELKDRIYVDLKWLPSTS